MEDLKFAVRWYRRRPGFTASVLVTLALGIGAATAMFSVVDGVLLRSLPYPDADRLGAVTISVPAWEDDPDRRWASRNLPLSWTEVVELQNRATAPTVGAFSWQTRVFRQPGAGVELVDVVYATPEIFGYLGPVPTLGRVLTAHEVGPASPRVAVISHRLWAERLDSDPGVLGRPIRLGEADFEVVGVLPEGFSHPGVAREAVDVWLPAGLAPQDAEDGNHHYRLLAAVPPGFRIPVEGRGLGPLTVTVQGATAQARVVAEPLKTAVTAGSQTPLYLLLLAACLLMAIACFNVANLLVGEAVARRSEVAARSALGASRARIWRQLLSEHALLGASGAALALLPAWGGTRLIVALAPAGVPRMAAVELDFRAALFAGAVGIVAVVAFGVLPALGLARVSPAETLGSARAGVSRSRRTARRLMVATQIAVAVVLLVGAGLLGRSLQRLTSVDPGYDPEGLSYVAVSAWTQGDVAAYRDYIRRAMEGVRELDGVAGAAAISELPMTTGGSATRMGIDDRPGTTVLQYRVASAGFTDVLGLPVLEGRSFETSDRAGAPPVALVSRSVARAHWPEGAVGGRVTVDDVAYTVVGVVGDVRDRDLSVDPRPTVYLPLGQTERRAGVVVARSAAGPVVAMETLRERVRRADPEVVLLRSGTMDAVVAASVAEERLRTLVLGFFAIMAGLLTAIGLYGVTADSIRSRVREMAIRTVLGARRSRLVSLVVRETLVLSGVGMAAGLAAAVVGSRILRPFLFGVTAMDPVSYLCVGGVLLGASTLAAWLPTRWLLRVEPAAILKQE